MGALAAGTALGQPAGEGNIPAPNIFDDQITCSMNVPTMNPMPSVVAMNADESVLDALIGMGTGLLVTDSTAAGYVATIEQLGYVIPPMGANCGAGALDTTDADSIADTASFAGYDADGNGDFTDDGDIAPKNAIPGTWPRVTVTCWASSWPSMAIPAAPPAELKESWTLRRRRLPTSSRKIRPARRWSRH